MRWQPPRTHRPLTDPITGFQVLGERNSGTNYVSRLLALNLGAGIAPREIYGWKHGFIDRRWGPDPGLLTVAVYRHPLRWLQSVHAKPLHLSGAMSDLPFSAFIRHPWAGAFRDAAGAENLSEPDLDPKAKTVFATPMHARAAKIAYFEEMAEMPARVVWLRFEDANRNPRATLAAIAAAFDIPLKPYTPVLGFKGLARGNYLPKRMPPPSSEDLAFIRENLDVALEARIGYRIDEVPQADGLPWWDHRSLRARVRNRWGGIGRRGKG